jgi:hypothetical protein
MLIAGREIEGIGLGTAQFAFRDGTAEDSVAWLRAQPPAIVPLAGASKPGSIRDSAAPFGLVDLDLEELRAG